MNRLSDLFRFLTARAAIFIITGFLAACGGVQKPAPSWPPVAQKWFDRAEHSYQVGDLSDAHLASENALASLPSEPKVRGLAAKVAMAELEFERALQLLADLPGSEAAGLRGRCHWYLDHLDEAADELSKVTADPDIKDEWAKAALELAHAGRGRRPFEMTGALLAAVEMPRGANTAMLVPVEVNGEPSLAMIATDQAESVIDGKTSSWVSLRFSGRLEVSDVPAMAQDLSGLAREIGAPVKMLLGAHLLRRLRATIDLSGRQFVARTYNPPPPPEATTILPIFYKGGAIVLPGAFGEQKTAPSSALLMNTSVTFPVALDEAGWKKAGQDPSSFVAVPGRANLRHGLLPLLRLGAFEIPNIPGVVGFPVEDVEQQTGVDLDGVAGSGLFATFRLTFADEGRTLWMEDLPASVIEERRAALAAYEATQQAGTAPQVPLPASEQPAGAPPRAEP